ncbi:hypothetical protein KY360_00015 [Candidatus Woesearchaeota archaeon]|nr:hypothetical protein [Candidatus Woesearchaeota archaeon]
MIFIIVMIILWLFFIYLVHTIFSTGLVFFINICIIALTATRASTDLKKEKMAGFYLASSLLTVALFVAEETKLIKPIFDFLSKAYVLPISIALIFILFFAHILKLGSVYGRQLVEFCKEKMQAKPQK